MSKKRTRPRTNSPARADTSRKTARLYYDDELLYRRAAKETFTRTTFEIEGEGAIIPARGDHNIRPRGTTTWYLNGPPGTSFSTNLTFQGHGGHDHGAGSSDSRAAGTSTPPSGVLQGAYPQNLIQIYRAGEVCGRVQDQTRLGSDTFVEFYNIAVGGLVGLAATTGVVLVGSTAQHGSNHWGIPALCNAIGLLGAAFHAEFKKPIYVNDMSLQWGGLFDIDGNFAPPHQTHDDGRKVDMNWSTMSNKERKWFQAKAEEVGFTVELHPNPNHWHLILK